MKIQIQRIFVITDLLRIFRFLPVFVWFYYKYGRVGRNLGSQSGWRPNKDMKMSSAPSFGAPGSLILVEVAQGLKKHVFTAMLAQHVASELRMHLWTSRSRTDRNTRNTRNLWQPN